MNKETNECESYKKILAYFIKSQAGRGTRRVLSQVFGADSANNNLEAERKTQLDLAFQECQLSKLNRIECQLDEITNSHHISSSNKPG